MDSLSQPNTPPEFIQIFPPGTVEEQNLLNNLDSWPLEQLFITWLPQVLLDKFLNYISKSDFALFIQGLQYEHGLCGVNQNISLAYDCYNNAAKGNRDVFSMYRMYLIHLRDYDKFKIKRDRNLEKFFLFKTYTFSQYEIIRNCRYFWTKIELLTEIRKHFHYEDERCEKFPKLMDYLKNNENYKIPTNTLELIKYVIFSKFNFGDISFKNNFEEFDPNIAEKYEIEIIYKMACLLQHDNPLLATKYFEICEQKHFYLAYLDYGEFLYNRKEYTKALSLFDIGYHNWNYNCLFYYFDLFFYDFSFIEFKKKEKEEQFQLMSKLLHLLLLDFSFGNLYSLFEFFYLRKICNKLYGLQPLIDREFKNELIGLVHFLYDMTTKNQELAKRVFHKNMGLAEFNLNLGYLYFRGIDNVLNVDLQQALILLKRSFKLAQSKNYARFVYSFVYKVRKTMFDNHQITQEKMEKTKIKLYKLYKTSFEEEDESAESSSSFLYYLGIIYLNGLGIKKDFINAYSFLKKSINVENKLLGVGSIVSFYRRYKSKQIIDTNNNFKEVDKELKSLTITDDEGYGEDNTICCICFIRKRNKVIIPCRHSFCSSCIEKIVSQKSKCPICRGKINMTGECKNITPQDGGNK